MFTALVVGYIFAGKIWETRIAAITKITVFAAVLMAFYTMYFPALEDWAPMVKEAYEDMYPEAATWSTSKWFAVERLVIAQAVFINVVMVLVLGFIRLYVGSMLRRPAKSGE